MAQNYSAELDAVKVEMKEVKGSKLALEIEYQQTKVMYTSSNVYLHSANMCICHIVCCGGVARILKRGFHGQ